MPKGKQAAALFEVINRNRQPGGKTAPLRTPDWWNRKKNRDAEREAAAAGEAPSTGGGGGRGEVPAWVNWKTGGIVGVAVVFGIVLIAVAGRGHGDRPQTSDKTTEELLAGPPQPGVMEIKRGEAGLEPAGGATQVNGGSAVGGTNGQSHQQPIMHVPTENGAGNVAVGTVVPSAGGNGGVPLPADGKRVVGLNYVVVQSYPERKGAEDARDVLVAAGVPASVEQKLRGLNSSWFSVVGTDGFDRVRSGPYLTYEKHIRQISAGFAKKKSFKAFEPLPYKWAKSDP